MVFGSLNLGAGDFDGTGARENGLGGGFDRPEITTGNSLFEH